MQQQAAQKAETESNYVDLSLAESDSVRKDFETGWRAFEKKDYRAAIARFKDFLKRNPKSKLAANAQYSIGESHFGRGNSTERSLSSTRCGDDIRKVIRLERLCSGKDLPLRNWERSSTPGWFYKSWSRSIRNLQRPREHGRSSNRSNREAAGFPRF